MKRVRDALMHHLNPLHVYCRLRPCMSQKGARVLAGIYERCFFCVFFGK